MNKLIKVFDVKGTKKQRLIIRTFLTDITDMEDKKVAELQVASNGITPLIEINGHIIGLDINAFIEEIIENYDTYVVNYLKENIDSIVTKKGE